MNDKKRIACVKVNSDAAWAQPQSLEKYILGMAESCDSIQEKNYEYL